MENTFNKYKIIKASNLDALIIWEILEQAIIKRNAEGSNQWQDGYPNLDVIYQDIQNEEGFVILNDLKKIVGYVVMSTKPEPAYQELKSGWLSENMPYLVIHRLAISQTPKIKGLATWVMQQAEGYALQNKMKSIKVDTNYDNQPMLAIFNKLNYTYCGEVYFRGSPRKAFEKQLV